MLTRNNWRASLVPAAAVIPAPVAYLKVVAVKKLVVGLLRTVQSLMHFGVGMTLEPPFFVVTLPTLNWVGWCESTLLL